VVSCKLNRATPVTTLRVGPTRAPAIAEKPRDSFMSVEMLAGVLAEVHEYLYGEW